MNLEFDSNSLSLSFSLTHTTIKTNQFNFSSADSAYLQFFGDDFLRTILLRYIFCDVVLRTHMSFRGRHQRPRCEPPLPAVDLLEHPSLAHIVLQLASALDVRDQFHEGATDIE